MPTVVRDRCQTWSFGFQWWSLACPSLLREKYLNQTNSVRYMLIVQCLLVNIVNYPLKTSCFCAKNILYLIFVLVLSTWNGPRRKSWWIPDCGVFFWENVCIMWALLKKNNIVRFAYNDQWPVIDNKIWLI